MSFGDSIKKMIGIEELDDDEMITEEEVTAAKEKMANDSAANYYFSTIDAGLTYQHEPEASPDLAHYDAMSVLSLGHLFGEYVVEAYRAHNAK